MGLLDLMNRPGMRQGLGLLAAAGPSPVPMSFGQRAMGLLSQMDAQKAAEEERQAQAQMRALQQQLLQAQIDERQEAAGDRRTQRERDAAAAQERARQEELLRRALQPVQPIDANRVSGVTGPRPEALSAVGQRQPLDFAALRAQGVPIQMLEEAAKLQTLGMPEVARTVEVRGPDGMPRTIQLDKQGRPVGEGFDKPVEMRLENLGGKSVAINPFALQQGQEFQRTVTPDALLSAETTRRGQNMTDARSRESNDLNRQAQRTQLIETPQGWMVVDKGTGVGDRLKSADGQPVPSDSTMKREGGAKRVLMLLDDAEKLVNKATGSFIGAGVDLVGRAFGGATPGAEAIGQLKALEGSLLAEMPRMEGPQSNADVKMYQQAAGALGDPTTPRAVKQAAIQTIRTLQGRYAGVEPSSPGQLGAVRRYNPATGKIE